MFKFVEELKKANSLKGVSRKQAAEVMAAIQMPTALVMLSKHFPVIVVATMWLGSTFITLTFAKLVYAMTKDIDTWIQVLALATIPMIFGLSFVCIGGLLSMLGRPGIQPGKFPRSPAHPVYALRRIYGTAWTQIYYFKALYSTFLAVPLFKKLLFRLFGYKGSSEFVVYPDAWIRDLPLLKIGKGAYLANRCTVGTNLCLNDGSILVGNCTFEENSMVGHLAIFGLGCKIGVKSEIGVGASLGIRVTLGDSVVVSPKAVIYHGVKVGNGARIGACSVIGMKAVIGEGVELPIGAHIPSGAQILTQGDAERFFSAESQSLIEKKGELVELLRTNLDGFDLKGR